MTLVAGGYFLIPKNRDKLSSPQLKINRITDADKPFIDAAKQVKARTKVDSKMQMMIFSAA